MKLLKILLINILIAVSLPQYAACQTYTNGIYVKNRQSIEVDKKFHQFKGLDLLNFSNGLVAQVQTNSDFTINSLFQEVYDLDKPAHKAKFGNMSFAGTLMSGEATFTYSDTNENNACVISTPMTDLELGKGTFYVKVSETSVIAVALEGSFKGHGEKRKVVPVTAGSALVASPIDRGIFEDKYSLDVKKVTTDNIKKLLDESIEVIKVKDSYLYIVIDGKIVGVNIN